MIFVCYVCPPKKFQICSLIAKVSLTIVKCPQKPNLWILCHFKAQ